MIDIVMVLGVSCWLIWMLCCVMMLVIGVWIMVWDRLSFVWCSFVWVVSILGVVVSVVLWVSVVFVVWFCNVEVWVVFVCVILVCVIVMFVCVVCSVLVVVVILLFDIVFVVISVW